MKQEKSSAVWIFVGLLLVVIFIVGMVCEKNPSAFSVKYRYDLALEQFCSFCVAYRLPAAILGIPIFLVSLIMSLVRESKRDRQR